MGHQQKVGHGSCCKAAELCTFPLVFLFSSWCFFFCFCTIPWFYRQPGGGGCSSLPPSCGHHLWLPGAGQVAEALAAGASGLFAPKFMVCAALGERRGRAQSQPALPCALEETKSWRAAFWRGKAEAFTHGNLQRTWIPGMFLKKTNTI